MYRMRIVSSWTGRTVDMTLRVALGLHGHRYSSFNNVNAQVRMAAADFHVYPCNHSCAPSSIWHANEIRTILQVSDFEEVH